MSAPAQAGAQQSQARGAHVPVMRRLGRAAPLVPATLLLIVFIVGPIIWSVYGSFTNTALTGRRARDPQFIGLDNYARLLQDPDFPKSVWLTVCFVVLSAVVGQNILGFFLAMMNRAVGPVLRAVVGTIVIAAWVLPEIVASFTMYAFFSDGGTLDAIANSIGITVPNMLYEHPMASVILANIWRGTAFSMLVYQAALADVPPELSDAAQVDGASPWQRLIRVTLPVIRQTIATNLMLTTLQTLSVFTLIWVMTGGGPGTDSSTLPVFAYQMAFKSSQVGYGTAIATVMLIIGAAFSIAYIRVLRPEVD